METSCFVTRNRGSKTVPEPTETFKKSYVMNIRLVSLLDGDVLLDWSVDWFTNLHYEDTSDFFNKIDSSQSNERQNPF